MGKSSPLIRLHTHCRKCMAVRPVNQSPEEWSRLDAGITAEGIQIWCKRCRVEVVHLTPAALAEALETARCHCCPGGMCVN